MRTRCEGRGRLSSASGFTLTELIVGLVILGAVLAMSVPAISRSARTHRVRSSATQIHTALMKARSSAVTRSSTIRMDLWPESGVTITREDSDNDGIYDNVLGWIIMSDGVQMASADFNGVPWVSFGPDGVPSSAGSIRIQVGLDLAREIRVAAGSGSSTIENPNGGAQVD